MLHNPEYIRPSEMFRAREMPNGASGTRLSRERLEQLIALRESQLSAVEIYIAASLADALKKKIEYEHAKLQEIAEADALRTDEKKRMSLRLKAEYFTLRPLEVELL